MKRSTSAAAVLLLAHLPGWGQQTPVPAPPLPQAPTSADGSAGAAQSGAGGTVTGVVKSGTTPLPGVTVTAKNTLTGKQYVTATDATGAYALHIDLDGRYVIRVEFAAFSAATQEVLLHGGTAVAGDFALVLASREPAVTASGDRGGSAAGAPDPGGRSSGAGARQYAGGGAQNLGLLAGALGAAAGGDAGNVALPSAAQNSDISTESVAVTGQSGISNPFAGINQDQMRDNLETMQQQETLAQIPGQRQTASPDFGIRGGPPGGGRGFNFRRFNPSRPHGALFYTAGNSIFDAKDFALRGQPVAKPAYNSNRFGLIYAGAPYIPHLIENDKKDFFFLSLIGNRTSAPFDQYGTVPDPLQRTGDFSGSGQPVLYDPSTGQPFPGNVIPANRISPQATALLGYVPLPNISTAAITGNRQNYQRLTTATTNTTQVGVRYNRSFGSGTAISSLIRQFTGASAPGLQQSVNANVNYTQTSADELNLFAALGGSQKVHQYAVQAGYTISHNRLTNNVSASLNRTDTQIVNLFTNRQDIASSLGIHVLNGAAVNPINYGLPSITLVQFSGLNEQQPSSQVSQSIGVSESSSWQHGKHNVKFGGDYKRIHLNTIGQTNSTGTLIFTGLITQQQGSGPLNGTATNQGNGQPSTGSSLADFLLGAPQQTTLQAPYQKAYLRENVYDLFLQDDWRLRANFTVLAGLRWEYFSPYTEKMNRLATLDPSRDFTQVATVLAGGTGPYTGPYPDSLIRPDRRSVSPRIGFAWRAAHNTVIRGGYAINYANGQYASFVQNLAFQPPFADVQTNQATQGASITLANGFGAPETTGNYAVNRDFRLPYVQVWNLDVQRTLPAGIVLNVGYNGARGARLDVLTAPGRSSDASLSGVYYNYSDSIGFSNYHAGTIRLRRRLHSGIALGATYTYSHAIDDASAIGGNGGTTAVVAQNWQNIRSEESNSSFDIRHNVKGDFVYELPFGPDAHFLTSGNWSSHLLANTSLSGNFGLATGEPLTPHFVANSADVARGTAGSLRPNRVPGSSLTSGGGTLNRWFNTEAFSSDFAPGQVYGTASRYSIPGPGTVTFDTSLSKSVRFGETRNLELRATADNIFNTVQYAGVDTNLGSSTYGQVTATAAQRRVTFLARFRY